MSKINDLIKGLCPNGVKYKKIDEVCEKIYAGGTPSTTHEEYYNGNIKWLRSGEINFNELYDTEMKITEVGLNNSSAKIIPSHSVVIAMTGATVARTAMVMEDMSMNQSVCALVPNNEINYRFLYQVLTNKYFELKQFGQGVLTSLNLDRIKKIVIPVPPIEVQEEIARILDKFGELDAELEEELEARKSQYEFWRDKIFEVEYSKELNFKLGDCIEKLTTGLNPRKNFKLNEPGANLYYITGKDVFNHTINISNRTDLISSDVVDLINKRAKLEDDILMFASTGTGTVGRMTYVEKYDKKWNVSETMFLIKTKSNLLTKYLMYYLESNIALSQYKEKISRGSVPHLKVKDLLDVYVPLIDIKEQKEIVDIIDKFESLSSSIICGLPAEIELRRKQYEYYRNKLLSFEELSVSE